MTTPLAGVTESSMTEAFPAGAEVAKLDNGMTLVAYATPQPVASMSLFVRAGSRYEYAQDAGSSHFLKRYAFRVRSLPLLFQPIPCILHRFLLLFDLFRTQRRSISCSWFATLTFAVPLFLHPFLARTFHTTSLV